MKKFVLALTAVAALTGSASAADLGPVPTPRLRRRSRMRRAGPASTSSAAAAAALGCRTPAQPALRSFGSVPPSCCTNDQRQGGDGWFGTVGVGYDWQFNGSWVAGIFADGQFGSIKGSVQRSDLAGIDGRRKAAGQPGPLALRLGYLVAPNVLSYVNGGYSGSHWSGTTLLDHACRGAADRCSHRQAFNRDGWFVGGGVENNLNIFGITAPGWFMKTEYRVGLLRPQDAVPRRLFDGTQLRRVGLSTSHFKPLDPDHQHLAGLSLQLEWPGGRQVLISD